LVTCGAGRAAGRRSRDCVRLELRDGATKSVVFGLALRQQSQHSQTLTFAATHVSSLPTPTMRSWMRLSPDGSNRSSYRADDAAASVDTTERTSRREFRRGRPGPGTNRPSTSARNPSPRNSSRRTRGLRGIRRARDARTDFACSRSRSVARSRAVQITCQTEPDRSGDHLLDNHGAVEHVHPAGECDVAGFSRGELDQHWLIKWQCLLDLQ
jgi:hypothetical protein